ncbi:MAG: PhaM family polyhydroxyalkanoate granule multifunctional regulatory protein [Polaromonas sp.]
MSQPTPSFPDFGKLVPGFDFLQNLTKQATGSAAQSIPQLPNLANWIAPTLNVEELDKRVQELKAVQFWLDQNAAALKATIQALEVQKMTLATLKGMNFNIGEMANAFKIKVGDSLGGGAQRTADKAKTFAGLEVAPSTYQSSKTREAEPAKEDEQAEATATAKPAAGMADPMQWWGALTQQFQSIAAEAMKEVAKTATLDVSKNPAAGMAQDAVKTATDMATGLAKGIAETASKTMTSNWPKPDAGKPAPRAKAEAGKAATAKPAPKPAAKPAAKSASAKTPARKSAPRKTTR